MKSSLCSLFITLSFLFIFPYQCVSARVSEGTGLLHELEVLREIAQNYQEKTTTQQTKTTTQAPKPAIKLQDYVGRYQADPSMVENFILDVFVEKDQLWIKPSHSPKSQLAAKSADSFVITAVNGPITFNRDAKGLVESLTLVQSPASGTKPLIAKKLTLPSPSLKGNTTFRLKGHPNARVVAVAGSFNDWNQSQVLCGKEGDEWVCRIDLAPGKYTYKFIIDGDWILDPANPDTEDDERGITNSVLVVK
ncbi:MAG TPA: DUF3471 domain-containing protein [Pyrinomonadaceae bacterium]|nr:DUF3471 domain-containing protein [Pyrinomonadaceae bacterium]